MSFIKKALTIPAGGNDQTLEVRASLARVQYERSSGSPYDPGATMKVDVVHEGCSNETVLDGISLDTSGIWYPLSAAHDSDGSAITGEKAQFALAGGRIRITITGGGSGTGDFLITFDT